MQTHRHQFRVGLISGQHRHAGTSRSDEWVLSDEMSCNCDPELICPSCHSRKQREACDTVSAKISRSRFLLWVVFNEQVFNEKECVAAVTRTFLLLLVAKQICGACEVCFSCQKSGMNRRLCRTPHLGGHTSLRPIVCSVNARWEALVAWKSCTHCWLLKTVLFSHFLFHLVNALLHLSVCVSGGCEREVGASYDAWNKNYHNHRQH